jgi:hypothetical protein
MEAARRWLRLITLCGGVVVLYFVVPATPRLPADAVVARGVTSALWLLLLAWLLVRQLRLQVDQGDRRIDGLVVSVVAVVVVFSLAFYLMALQRPGEIAGLHTRVDALYFTMSTLTTVGFGDVHATGQTARVLVLVQMVFNVVFVTTAAALLSSRIRSVAAERAAAHRHGGGEPADARTPRRWPRS